MHAFDFPPNCQQPTDSSIQNINPSIQKLATAHSEFKLSLAGLAIVFGPVSICVFLGGVGLHAGKAFDASATIAPLGFAVAAIVVKELVAAELGVTHRTRKGLSVGGSHGQVLVGKQRNPAAVAI